MPAPPTQSVRGNRHRSTIADRSPASERSARTRTGVGTLPAEFDRCQVVFRDSAHCCSSACIDQEGEGINHLLSLPVADGTVAGVHARRPGVTSKIARDYGPLRVEVGQAGLQNWQASVAAGSRWVSGCRVHAPIVARLPLRIYGNAAELKRSCFATSDSKSESAPRFDSINAWTASGRKSRSLSVRTLTSSGLWAHRLDRKSTRQDGPPIPAPISGHAGCQHHGFHRQCQGSFRRKVDGQSLDRWSTACLRPVVSIVLVVRPLRPVAYRCSLTAKAPT